jgi:uncharacterized protein with NRDE domain
VLLEEPFRVYGGRDLESGGSWIGVNERRVVVGLTNYQSRDRGRRSRGEIVLEALGCETAGEIETLVRSRVVPGSYRPFNLLFGTADDLRVARFRADALSIDRVSPGLHVLPSGNRLDDPDSAKVRRGYGRLREAAEAVELESLVESLRGALSDHEIPERSELPEGVETSDLGLDVERRVRAVCVHTERYGTCSATMLAVGRGATHYYFADGPPCTAPFRSFAHIMT